MSGVALMINVGGTKMVVQMDDHFTPIRRDMLRAQTFNVVETMRTCRTCGALTVDFEVHLVWHINRGEMQVDTGPVMPQDVDGDEVGAPDLPRIDTRCSVCQHHHPKGVECTALIRSMRCRCTS